VIATVVPNRIDNLAYALTYTYHAMILQGKIHVLRWILNPTLLYRYQEIHSQWGSIISQVALLVTHKLCGKFLLIKEFCYVVYNCNTLVLL
jgi:hypothetical protein